ncbi:helix-turn-helix domain-containing protein [uncultured Salegentibacter sp.]|mgnify:CR=1 FL=1|jgi:transcriptional regulator with XRE-family HTH domain|uniref:helix-turn-helix domain-containing protein n=1 Tax=uncultured Salegentibacter sp. TaxID=259320 RepID=UPI0030D97620|tara:strand:+ start:781 stop:1128 length:348 start_codon:yes stop_codon:yes gene_type:complete
MVNNDNNWKAMTDAAIIREIGAYVKHQRLQQNRTQELTASAAGLNRWTISQLENGEPVSLQSLIQILRALDLLHVFEAFRIEKKISPLQLAKMEHQQRERASKNLKTKNENDWLW